jgi:hypothetical protein
MAVDEIESPAPDQRHQRAQRARVLARVSVAPREGHSPHRYAAQLQAGIDNRFARARHLRLEPVLGQPQRELHDILGHAAVRGLENEEDTGQSERNCRGSARRRELPMNQASA